EKSKVAGSAAAASAAAASDGSSCDHGPGAISRRSHITLPAYFAGTTENWVSCAGCGVTLGHSLGAFLSLAVAGHSGSDFALASTSFARSAKGKRTDYVEVFDPVTFLPIADIELPDAPRFSVGPRVHIIGNCASSACLLFFLFGSSAAAGLSVPGASDDQLTKSASCFHIHPGAAATHYLGSCPASLAASDLAAAPAAAGIVGAQCTGAQNCSSQAAQANYPGMLVWAVASSILQGDIPAAGATMKAAIDGNESGRKADNFRSAGFQMVAKLKNTDGIMILTVEHSRSCLAAAENTSSVTASVGQTSGPISNGHDSDAIIAAQDGASDNYANSAGTEVLDIYDAASDQDQSSVELDKGPESLSVQNEA
uniref:METHYLAMINE DEHYDROGENASE (HEAVY SUBUNIT) n=1 Tax=Paracoccus denitrificans TaxID=266 RepID=UPI00001125AF|nr:Chain H, Methylamine Dehydrogenase (heavy Subunit) [Paracoccus denitrificans]1MDA_J Chain J, Methylamine Dehydrogenase (heavy Subunit) [Paracoccus denitrificans]